MVFSSCAKCQTKFGIRRDNAPVTIYEKCNSRAKGRVTTMAAARLGIARDRTREAPTSVEVSPGGCGWCDFHLMGCLKPADLKTT
jgi:hypothetical protein